MRTAVVATIWNEARRLPEFLASLESQTRKPDVVMVTDGGSTDGSQKVLEDFAARATFPFRWASVPGNRSRGRNEAIRQSGAELIAVTDVSVLDPAWFAWIIAPLEMGTADLVIGWYELRADNPRERCIGLLTQFSRDQVRPKTFLPSSRSVAFTRDLWERAGGYPDAYSGNEDTIFDLAMERLGPRKVYVPDAVVYWRPAGSVRQVYRQYRKYAVGDGQAAIFLTKETWYAGLYVAYGGGLVLILAGFLWWPLYPLLLILALGYLGFRIRKVFRARMWAQVPYAVCVILAWDLGRIVGYTKGRLDRLRRGMGYYRY